MSYENILYSVEPPVALITINRPKVRNALDQQTVAELQHAVEAASADPAVRALVLTGAGEKAFVAGADIAAMAEMSAEEALAFAEAGHRLCATLEAIPKPSIAAVNGFALGGGCELAMACDLLLAAETATLGQPEVKLGIIPGFGGTQRLARRVPLGVARELVYTGRTLGAAEAYRIGLVNSVHPADALLGKARELAAEIGKMGPLAVARAKRLMTVGPEMPLAAACELERQTFAALFSSKDQREGMRAFLERRPAAFEGK